MTYYIILIKMYFSFLYTIESEDNHKKWKRKYVIEKDVNALLAHKRAHFLKIWRLNTSTIVI
jgi:hypothetical protein